jgi:hypothetical protein
MSFHHIDSASKRFMFAGSHLRCWNEIRTELDKCVLLCMNCHAEVHDSIQVILEVRRQARAREIASAR